VVNKSGYWHQILGIDRDCPVLKDTLWKSKPRQALCDEDLVGVFLSMKENSEDKD
jgi:hypothetical protein